MASINIKKDGQWTGNPVLGFKVGEENLTNELKEKIASGADVDLSGYATKEEVETLTAADVGARPADWMPNAADVGAVSIHGGSIMLGNIDMNGKIIYNVPKPNGWGDVANKGYVDDALATKAPLLNIGQYLGDLNSSALDNTICWIQNTTTNNPTGTYGTCETWAAGNGGRLQRITCSLGIVQRIHTSSWGEWEWINSPMSPNIEYRTTERHNGKVVYTKLVQFGALPNNTEKSISAMPAGSSLIEAVGYASGSSYNVPIPGYYAIQSFGSTRSSGNLWLSTTIDMSSYNGWITIKYTKD